jgi:hypothetical protein
MNKMGLLKNLETKKINMTVYLKGLSELKFDNVSLMVKNDKLIICELLNLRYYPIEPDEFNISFNSNNNVNSMAINLIDDREIKYIDLMMI